MRAPGSLWACSLSTVALCGLHQSLVCRTGRGSGRGFGQLSPQLCLSPLALLGWAGVTVTSCQ